MIDKYLGDGFFAYWREDKDATQHASLLKANETNEFTCAYKVKSKPRRRFFVQTGVHRERFNRSQTGTLRYSREI
jgi:hypothetical protein